MDEKFSKLSGVEVLIDQVVSAPDLTAPTERPHAFVYFLTISNQSAAPIKILARKWILKSNDGSTLVVEGEGVVGEKPSIEAGSSFAYNSYHVIAHETVASGSFFGVKADGDSFRVDIPAFKMTPK